MRTRGGGACALKANIDVSGGKYLRDGYVPVVADTDYTLFPRYDDSRVDVVAAALQFRQEDRLAAAAELVVIHPRGGLYFRCHFSTARERQSQAHKCNCHLTVVRC